MIGAHHLAIAIIGAGATAYALLGGADFGGGAWHLLARGLRKHQAQTLISRAMGPVWEANHVWLIFILIGLFSAFPIAYGALSRALIAPIGLALIGIVLRGAAFVFAQYGAGGAWQRAFAISSALTPAMLGLAVGALASDGFTSSEPMLSPFTKPVGWWGAALATSVSILLAAVFLCRDAERAGDIELTEDFRRRAFLSAIASGVIALAGLPIVANTAPRLAAGFLDAALPLVLISAAAGVTTLVLLWRRSYLLARGAAALASACVLWGWGAAQFPHFGIDGLTVHNAAGPPATLKVVVAIMIAGFALIIPSMLIMFRIFQSQSVRS